MRAAVIQTNSTDDRTYNIEIADSLVRAAAVDGATLILLPEKWSLLAAGQELLDGAEGLDGEAITAARDWARELGVSLVAGSLTIWLDDAGPDSTGSDAAALPVNCSVLIGPDGEISATYSKLHMFDVEVDGVEYRESATERTGETLTVAEIENRDGDPPARIGMTICYDLRFPELYRSLLDRGANLFTVPSAFTAVTGRAHWEPLLRARAIENQAFVLAANQTGQADPQFDSWGHSMIIDPWGEVLAAVESSEGFAAADLDFSRLEEVRRKLPALEHRRLDLYGPGSSRASGFDRGGESGGA